MVKTKDGVTRTLLKSSGAPEGYASPAPLVAPDVTCTLYLQQCANILALLSVCLVYFIWQCVDHGSPMICF